MTTTTLSLPLPINKKWNVVWDSGKKNYTSSEDGILVTYAKGEFAASGGANFRVVPESIFPCASVALEYKVYFPEGFDFVKGGKLPGIWGGEPGASGGDWNANGWSFRVMFREGGQAVAYVYMATDQGKYDGDEKCPLVKNQGRGFDAIAHHTNGAGIDLWRDQGLKLVVGRWNSIALKASVNSPGQANGLVELTVNGKTKSFDKIQWFEKTKKINGMMFTSWFGGGSEDYAPRKTQKATFKDFVLTKQGV